MKNNKKKLMVNGITYTIEHKKTSLLNENEIDGIIKIKNLFWRFGLKNQKIWFIDNIKKNDLHILFKYKEIIIGYNSLRQCKIENENNTKKFFWFDTLIINNNFRGAGLSSEIMDYNSKLLLSMKKFALLTCKKKLLNYYERFSWQPYYNNKFKFIKFPKINNLMINNIENFPNITRGVIKLII